MAWADASDAELRSAIPNPPAIKADNIARNFLIRGKYAYVVYKD